jgi:glycosyltransferase involved in cell wall biosynthesis
VVVHHIGIPIPDVLVQTEKVWDIAFVGRFVEKKGVLDLVEAIALLDRVPKPHCVFIGDGPLFDVARARATEVGIDATFLGPQSPEVVRNTLAASHVFAAPSRTAKNGDSEGFGMVFLEAAAAGIPAASTLHGGVPEAVLDRETGLLSPERDVPALATNIALLLASQELRERLGNAARKRVERDFDVRRQTALLETIYDDVVAEATR